MRKAWRAILPAPPAGDSTAPMHAEEHRKMDEEPRLETPQGERREFLRWLGRALACGAAAVAANSVTQRADAAPEHAAGTRGAPSPEIPGYDWSKHRWAFGVDATKCIGCLRCVEACKTENHVPPDAHHFRTWVERYVYLEGEDTAHIDSQSDPVNIAASG